MKHHLHLLMLMSARPLHTVTQINYRLEYLGEGIHIKGKASEDEDYKEKKNHFYQGSKTRFSAWMHIYLQWGSRRGENEQDKTIKHLCLWCDIMSGFHVKLQQSLGKRRWHLKLDVIFFPLWIGSSVVIQLQRFKLNSVVQTWRCNTRAKVTCPEDPIQSPVFYTFSKHSLSQRLWRLAKKTAEKRRMKKGRERKRENTLPSCIGSFNCCSDITTLWKEKKSRDVDVFFSLSTWHAIHMKD